MEITRSKQADAETGELAMKKKAEREASAAVIQKQIRAKIEAQEKAAEGPREALKGRARDGVEEAGGHGGQETAGAPKRGHLRPSGQHPLCEDARRPAVTGSRRPGHFRLHSTQRRSANAPRARRGSRDRDVMPPFWGSPRQRYTVVGGTPPCDPAMEARGARERLVCDQGDAVQCSAVWCGAVRAPGTL